MLELRLTKSYAINQVPAECDDVSNTAPISTPKKRKGKVKCGREGDGALVGLL